MSKGYFHDVLDSLLRESSRQTAKTAATAEEYDKNSLRDAGSPDRIRSNAAEIHKLAAELRSTEPVRLDDVVAFWKM